MMSDSALRPTAISMLLGFAVALANGSSARAEEPMPAAEPPRPLVAVPLAVAAGQTSQVLVRGLRLDQAEQVSLQPAAGRVTLVKKEGTNVPGGQQAEQVGNTQAEIEITVPADFAEAEIKLVIASAAGAAKPLPLLVVPAERLRAESEPNRGFDDAQPLAAHTIVAGVIQNQRDVDVYRLQLAEDKHSGPLRIEVLAAGRGSAADPVLSLYSEAGHLLRTVDDGSTSRDPRIEFQPEAKQNYFVVIQDAHDAGGPAHPYVLRLIDHPRPAAPPNAAERPQP